MARKFPNQPKGGQNNMLKQVQKMQQDMVELQEEMEERTFSSSAGGGVVTATVSGKKTLVGLEIDPEAVDPDDVEMLQDMIIAAINEALRTAETTMEEEMSRITGGISMPGLF